MFNTFRIVVRSQW